MLILSSPTAVRRRALSGRRTPCTGNARYIRRPIGPVSLRRRLLFAWFPPKDHDERHDPGREAEHITADHQDTDHHSTSSLDLINRCTRHCSIDSVQAWPTWQ